MKIAILGGSFNPPHWGHLLVAHQVLDFTDIEAIWLTPCYQHTFDKELAPVEDRVKMTKMLTVAKIKFCGEEIDNKLSGETIELAEVLKKKYPQHQFSFIIGSDNLKDFKKWGSWERLLQMTQFLVFPRPGFDYDLKKYNFGRSCYKFRLIKHPLLATTNISSTLIRRRLAKQFPIDYLLPEKVKEYIKRSKLYQKFERST